MGAGAVGNQAVDAEKSDSKDSASGSIANSGPPAKPTSQNRRAERGEFRGRNAFVPRAVQPLGWSSKKPGGSKDDGDDKPKSNDEFRKMFLKN